MSEACIYLFNQVIYMPNFDGYDFDYDARPMYDSIERATREAVS